MAVIRQYTNTAVNTRLAATMPASATELIVESNAGYPTNPTPETPFTLRINPGAPDEEIVDVVGGRGTAAAPWRLSTTDMGSGVQVRSKDGTTNKEWLKDTPVVHGFSARDFREMQTAVNRVNTLISDAFPIGGICMWSGDLKLIPAQFALCDGRYYRTDNGLEVGSNYPGALRTPDLRNKFVYGASDIVKDGRPIKPVNTTGGSFSMTAAMMPSHSHTTKATSHSHTMPVSGLHNHDTRYLDNWVRTTTGGTSLPVSYNTGRVAGSFVLEGSSGHTHPINNETAHTHEVNPSGGSPEVTAENNLPPYVVLAYIIKKWNGPPVT